MRTASSVVPLLGDNVRRNQKEGERWWQQNDLNYCELIHAKIVSWIVSIMWALIKESKDCKSMYTFSSCSRVTASTRFSGIFRRPVNETVPRFLILSLILKTCANSNAGCYGSRSYHGPPRWLFVYLFTSFSTTEFSIAPRVLAPDWVIINVWFRYQ